MLPELGLGLLVSDEALELRRDGPLAALRAQPQVDLVEQAAPRRHRQRRDEALRQARVIDDRVELARPGALAALLVEIVEHHEVEIGAGRQLAGAETAEAEDRDLRAGHGAVLRLETPGAPPRTRRG